MDNDSWVVWPQGPAQQESEVCGEGGPGGECLPRPGLGPKGRDTLPQALPGSSHGVHTLNVEHEMTGSGGIVLESCVGICTQRRPPNIIRGWRPGGWRLGGLGSSDFEPLAARMEHPRLCRVSIAETDQGWKSKVRVPTDSGFTDGHLTVSLHGSRGQCSVAFPTRALIPSMGPHPMTPLPPPRSPPQHHHTLRTRCQPRDVGGVVDVSL